VTRGRLPQKAGSLSLNGGGAAAAVPPAARLTRLTVYEGGVYQPVRYDWQLVACRC